MSCRLHNAAPLIAIAMLYFFCNQLLARPNFVEQDASYQHINATNRTTQAVSADWLVFDFDNTGWFTGAAPFSRSGASTFCSDQVNLDGSCDPGTAPALPGTSTEWNVDFDPYYRYGI